MRLLLFLAFLGLACSMINGFRRAIEEIRDEARDDLHDMRMRVSTLEARHERPEGWSEHERTNAGHLAMTMSQLTTRHEADWAGFDKRLRQLEEAGTISAEG